MTRRRARYLANRARPRLTVRIAQPSPRQTRAALQREMNALRTHQVAWLCRQTLADNPPTPANKDQRAWLCAAIDVALKGCGIIWIDGHQIRA